MYHNYGVISRRHTFTDCVWPITLVAGLHTTRRSEHVLVGSLQVTWNIPTFEALLKKKCACFLNDSKSPRMYSCAVWCSQIVCIRSSLNTTTASYSVIVRTCAGHNALVRHQGSAWVALCFLTCDFRVLLWMYCCTKCYELANNYVKKVSVMWCCTVL